MQRTAMQQKFDDHQKAIEGLKDAERQAIKERELKCDWDNVTDRAAYLAERRIKKRNRLLDKLCPGRVCPKSSGGCGGTFPNRKSWITNKLKTAVLCRGCWQKRTYGPLHAERTKMANFIRMRRVGKIRASAESLGTDERRRKIDGGKICELRESLKVSGRGFGKRMGWTSAYQKHLENGKVKSVTLVVWERLLKVFRELGAVFVEDGPEKPLTDLEEAIYIRRSKKK